MVVECGNLWTQEGGRTHPFVAQEAQSIRKKKLGVQGPFCLMGGEHEGVRKGVFPQPFVECHSLQWTLSLFFTPHKCTPSYF